MGDGDVVGDGDADFTGGTSGDGDAPGSGGGTNDCSEDCVGQGFVCCNGECVNVRNDIYNCGSCEVTCEGDFPYCDDGTCGAAPCSGASCGPQENCCNSECCGEGQLCCNVTFGQSFLGCSDMENGTCPKGCVFCICADPDTPVATPSGEVPIADLRIGDLVYSIDENGIVVVPLLQVNRTEVENHTVLSIRLESGREIRVSAGHPLGDGRLLSDLEVGETLHGVTIQSIGEVAYDRPVTHDILPATSTGIYFAAGVPIGSTLLEARPPSTEK
jgi:hypothetical protein